MIQLNQTLYQPEFFRETEQVGYIHTCAYEECYSRELAHPVVGTGKSETCRVGWQAGNLSRS